MVRKKEPWEQHTAAEVAAMSSDEAMAVRDAGARYQRGRPESAMNRIQKRSGGGVFSHAVEHVGDLTHRMNEHGGRHAEWTAVPKVQRTSGGLNHPYGFEREHAENISSNARYRGEDPAALESDIRSLGQTYADEHRRVPVYNYPSELARDAAVSLGEHRFDDTRTHLSTLNAMQFGGRDPHGVGWSEGDMMGLLRDSKQGMVDYLNDYEERIAPSVRAASAMLGGPPTDGRGDRAR